MRMFSSFFSAYNPSFSHMTIISAAAKVHPKTLHDLLGLTHELTILEIQFILNEEQDLFD
jgi:hypothetical protein